ncbi:MAG: Fic family protein, partial [bacterium]
MKPPQRPLYIWQQPTWPNWYFDDKALIGPLAQARQQQGIVVGKAQAIGLESDNLTQVVNEIWVQEVMATAAIEGQKLDFEQVRSSVMRKLGLADVGSSSRHVDGLVDVMHDASQNFAVALDVDRLCRWQSALFPGGTSGIARIEVGKLRTFQEPMQIISGSIGKEIVHYRAPDSAQVPIEIARFLAWFNQPCQMDGIVRAAVAHLWFETIHPFEDGNGRVGRAIMDMAIAQDARQEVRLYSMSHQMQENRSAYYDALHHAQTGDLDITPWLIWFVTQFSAACLKSGRHIDKALEKARYWSTHANKDFKQRQRKVLQKLLEAGDGGFLGGLSTDKYSKIAGTSKATASRDLADLLQKDALISRGVGRATKY